MVRNILQVTVSSFSWPSIKNWFRLQVQTIVIIDFHSSLSLPFFYVYCFWPTSGITRRNIQKYFLFKKFFFTKTCFWLEYFSFPSSFFFYVFCVWPTLGKLPKLKFCFHSYFGITIRNLNFFYNFNFLQTKLIFRRFFYFLWPAFGHGSLNPPVNKI